MIFNGIIIGIVVLMMAGLGFFEELRARNAMNSLSNLITPKAKLCRSGLPMHPYQWGLAFIPGLVLFAAAILRKSLLPNVFSRGKW